MVFDTFDEQKLEKKKSEKDQDLERKGTPTY